MRDKVIQIQMATGKDDKIRCRLSGCRVRNNANKSLNSTEMEEITEKKSEARFVEAKSRKNELESGTYWLTRIVFLRSFAFVYCKCFQYHCISALSIACRQNEDCTTF